MVSLSLLELSRISIIYPFSDYRWVLVFLNVLYLNSWLIEKKKPRFCVPNFPD